MPPAVITYLDQTHLRDVANTSQEFECFPADCHLLTSKNSSEYAKLLSSRKQPLTEIIYSEENYVKRLAFVHTTYINVPNLLSSTGPTHNPDSSEFAEMHLPSSPPPAAPEALLSRWRVLWGNWITLTEWHSAFLQKLKVSLDNDPDEIPDLFISSRTRLRSMYTKYCENHRKAALLATQHRDFFEELRIYFSDRDGILSHLMQPIQRIMRYQLPMVEVVKLTERANLSSLPIWRRALELMREIPRDAQLILEVSHF
ncbi:unnamed protein product [Protopolystoma xenopodis]|uniref:DH domain-containing protein n=1 Tax=Protopolystoma xenopodis TaxID=117903 RepID=A0A448WYA5_9PLAT|nr:unnamed protein product [Protopolystoma xenopodis]